MISPPGTRAPRVLYLPNESTSIQQVGGRIAFSELTEAGAVSELSVHSFLADFHTDRDRTRAKQALLDRVSAFKPDIIFWQHPEDFPLDDGLIRELRAQGGDPLIAYHDPDPFDRFYKRLLPVEETLYRHSDIFLTVALGGQLRLFQRVKAHPHYYYSPNFFTKERVGDIPDPVLVGSAYDAVMIGSIGFRMKLLKFPGSERRIKLARKLARLMGDRFACFGHHWPGGTNCRGFIHPVEQTRTIHSAKMSLIWEHFPENTFYYSDRLPISIASGIPHITSRRKGYDLLFPNVPGLFFADTVEDAVDIAAYLRSLPIERIIELGLAARAWAFSNLEAGKIFREAFAACVELWRKRDSTTRAQHLE